MRGAPAAPGGGAPAWRPGDELCLTTETLVAGGRGLARAPDGRVVLVAGALAGERVRAALAKTGRDFALADCREVLVASPLRVAPACPLAARCGGCDLMHLAPAAQAGAKAGWVAEALERVAPGLSPRVLASPRAWGYRQRARFQVAEGRLGFFAAGGHELVPVAACPVAAPGINRLLAGLAGRLAGPEGPAPAWLEILAGEREEDGVFATLGFARGPRPDSGRAAAWAELLRAAGARDLRLALAGAPEPTPLSAQGGVAYYQAGVLTLRAFPGFFCQVNFEANRLLIAEVLNAAGPAEGGSALDLYAGTGNFGLPLAAAGWRVLSVEAAPGSGRMAGWQAAAQRLGSRFTAREEEVGRALERLRREGARFGLVVLDPPRAGAKGLMGRLVELGPRRVVYVSCHPATLARDATELIHRGYAPIGLAVADLFPQTSHVETVLTLAREAGHGSL